MGIVLVSSKLQMKKNIHFMNIHYAMYITISVPLMSLMPLIM